MTLTRQYLGSFDNQPDWMSSAVCLPKLLEITLMSQNHAVSDGMWVLATSSIAKNGSYSISITPHLHHYPSPALIFFFSLMLFLFLSLLLYITTIMRQLRLSPTSPPSTWLELTLSRGFFFVHSFCFCFSY